MKQILRTLALLCFALLPLSASAQQAASKQVSLDLKGVSVKTFFAEVKKQTGLNFIYDADQAASWPKVSIKVQKRPVNEAIDHVVTSIGCSYSIKDNIVTVSKQVLSGNERTISGYVHDADGLALAPPTAGCRNIRFASARKATHTCLPTAPLALASRCPSTLLLKVERPSFAWLPTWASTGPVPGRTRIPAPCCSTTSTTAASWCSLVERTSLPTDACS